jgi:hypothetical protein
METDGAKFLFNIYIPKENGETSEIDVLMICPHGIFVFESKNYSGWIFGSEGQKNWYQTLPAGRGRNHKEHFYNPVMQNQSHIKHLTAFLKEPFPLRSIIVFSDRCTLKNVQIKSRNIKVINRYRVASVVDEICKQTPAALLTESSITAVYDKLYPLTQVSNDIKAQHVNNIRRAAGKKVILRPQEPEEQPADTQTESQTQSSAESAPCTVPINNTVQQTLPDNTPPENAAILICPRCHTPLVLRTASRGANAGHKFYGCSNYPKCRYIQNIADAKTKSTNN